MCQSLLTPFSGAMVVMAFGQKHAACNVLRGRRPRLPGGNERVRSQLRVRNSSAQVLTLQQSSKATQSEGFATGKRFAESDSDLLTPIGSIQLKLLQQSRVVRRSSRDELALVAGDRRSFLAPAFADIEYESRLQRHFQVHAIVVVNAQDSVAGPACLSWKAWPRSEPLQSVRWLPHGLDVRQPNTEPAANAVSVAV